MTTNNKGFAADVRAGLCASRKRLPSVYFYDDRGSRLFEDICAQPEYYPTRAEREILLKRADNIAAASPDPVQVVELGSGNSQKTLHLLKAMVGARERVAYLPIDVCEEMVEASAAELQATLPKLEIQPIAARYEDGLQAVDPSRGGILLLWLGSSIGNLGRDEAASFVAELSGHLSPGDRMLIGIDLIKGPDVLEEAYNDEAGVTAAFNLNMLERINRELGGAFDLERFRHVALYNAEKARVEMHIESLGDQTVPIEALGTEVEFKQGERIHTENSHKYDFDQIDALAKHGGLRTLDQWFDSRFLFSLNHFQVDGQGAAAERGYAPCVGCGARAPSGLLGGQ